jgi:GT2 family glycosyltransferase
MVMKTAVVVPSWNQKKMLQLCIESLLAQTMPSTIIVVDNGSTDGSKEMIESYGNKLVAIYNTRNLGFTGGVIPGMQYAIDNGYDAVALFNNDAVADARWLEHLERTLGGRVGIVTCSFRTIDKKHIDSTGDQFTVWGLPYPRGRGKAITTPPSAKEEYVFGASGGATLYSTAMLKEIGLMDDDFFAYFEDVDLSFRAQLAGWKVMTNHEAVAYHHISVTSKRMMKGFATYQSIKNWPFVIIKNVPTSLLGIVLPRFILAYVLFIGRACLRGQAPQACSGLVRSMRLWPRKVRQRRTIQKNRVASDDYIFSIMTHDLPENATNLRKLRALWWRLAKRSS